MYERMPVDVAAAVFSLLPLDLQSSAVIAGGSVRDYWHAKDVDLWLLGKDVEDCVRIAERVRGTFSDKSDLAILPFYPEKHLFKCCEFPFHPAPRGPQSLQIMSIVAETPMDLLEHFDLSVHQFAVLPSGRLMYGLKSSEPGSAPIRVTRFDTPYSTLRRYFLLCQRYSVKAYWPDVVLLCARITENEAKKTVGPETWKEMPL